MDVVMVAAECRGLVKVGGLADVVAELGKSLAARGCRIRIIIPFYDQISPSGLESARSRGTFNVSFEGRGHLVHHYTTYLGSLEVHLLRAVYFTGDYGSVYVNSSQKHRGPFEDDARRFAFFSTAVHTLLSTDPAWRDVTAVHAHDWHLGALVWLLKNEGALKGVKTVFTIHNLDYQGIRPFKGGLGESVYSWWPELVRRLPDTCWTGGRDPRYPDCFNLLRAGITQADYLTTVSPQYAREILLGDDADSHFIGGRGLEGDIQAQDRRGRFFGWLNGLDYGAQDPGVLEPPILSQEPLAGKLAHKTLLQSNWRTVIESSDLPDRELLIQKMTQGEGSSSASEGRPGDQYRPLVAMVTRVTPQKTALLVESWEGRPVWSHLLDRNLDLVVLGTGDQEKELLPMASHPRGFFLRTFNPRLSELLYSASDFFLMPSDFEPCGISQLVAMRYGSLPVVSARGGLSDTVKDGVTGFVFHGNSRSDQIRNLLSVVDRALELWKNPARRVSMMKAAMNERFTWENTTQRYWEIYSEDQ